MLPAKMPICAIKNGINQYFHGKEPWQIVTITSTSILLIMWFHSFVTDDEGIHLIIVTQLILIKISSLL